MRAVVSAVAALMMAAGATSAATIAETGPGTGMALELDPADFVGSGPCGFGNSVVNDGCSVVLKSDPSAPDAYGRFDALEGPWIDSQDLSMIAWTIKQDTPFTAITFALTDAFDQEPSAKFGLGPSYFRLLADGAEWSAGDARQGDSPRANGTLDWLTVRFDGPVTEATLFFETRLNDGFGVQTASISQVPLPASGAMLVFGVIALAAAYRRRA